MSRGNHFSYAPQVHLTRSKFNRNFDYKTTFNAGQLIPVYLDEVLPGDTFQVDTSFVVRMSTPIHPVMDNLFLDFYFYFVPNRLVWSHWEEFNGANKSGYWIQPVQYAIPVISSRSSSSSNQAYAYGKGSMADYFGIPTQVQQGTSASNTYLTWSSLPMRAYALIWNEFFRDENLQNPISYSTGDTTVYGRAPVGTGEGNYLAQPFSFTNFMSGNTRPAPVAKFHDYFTSALPSPQKGDPVSIPITGFAPVVTRSEISVPASTSNPSLLVGGPGGSFGTGFGFSGDSSGVGALHPNENTGSSGGSGMFVQVGTTEYPVSGYGTAVGLPAFPLNLWADTSSLSGVTINALRQAFQLQKLFEKDARGGTRYTEILHTHFHVTSPDSRLQRPEYLGGKRVPINISQVLQTSSTDTVTPQGNTAAYSLTSDVSHSFTKSFVEHGYILGLCCVRTDHTYQQGLHKLWSRSSRFDFYWPVFANIGEQPIYNRELYAIGRASDSEVFGYQEAWAEYRYKPSIVTGAFRSNYSGSLDIWHYADYYELQPILGDTWIRETSVNVDRTLAVQSSVEDQFIADFFFKQVCVRPMPMYSVPGLVDHH